MKRIIAILCVFSLALFAKDFNVDLSHSHVGFKSKHLSVSNVRGNFNKFKGVVSIDNNGKFSALKGEVDMSSVNTNDVKRDDHLREADFFDVAKFPKSTLIFKRYEGNKAIFDLTIKETTKAIPFSVEDNGSSKNRDGKEVRAFSLTSSIDRKDFDIAKSISSLVVGDKVDINIELELSEQ